MAETSAIEERVSSSELLGKDGAYVVEKENQAEFSMPVNYPDTYHCVFPLHFQMQHSQGNCPVEEESAVLFFAALFTFDGNPKKEKSYFKYFWDSDCFKVCSEKIYTGQILTKL